VANLPEEDLVLAVNIADVATDAEVVNGITVLTAGDGKDYRHLGAWADHSAVFAQYGFAPGQRPESLGKKYDGFSAMYTLKDPPRYAVPAEDATYRGVFFGRAMHPDRYNEEVRGTVELTYKEGGAPYIDTFFHPGTTKYLGDARVAMRFVVDNHPIVKTAETHGLFTDANVNKVIGGLGNLVPRREDTVNGAIVDDRDVWVQMTFHGPKDEEVVGRFNISKGIDVFRRHWSDLENGYWINGIFAAKK